MRRFLVWLGLLALASLGLANVAQAQVPAPHQAITQYDGPQTCATCHPAAAQEVVESLHYQQQGPVPFRMGWAPGKLGGMYVTY